MGVHAPTAILGFVEEILGLHEDFLPYVQQDARLHSLFYLETALLYMFRVVPLLIIRSANNYVYSNW
jgi:hypothetical protein